VSPDDSQFEQLYQSLPTGLVVAACTSKSFGMMLSLNEEILTSFCRSLKGAAIRRDSNAMHFWWGYSRKNWKTRGIEHFRTFVQKHNANGVRLFLINRPTDNAIDRHIAGLIQESALAKNVTAIVTTVAEDVHDGKFSENALAVKDRKDVHFRSGGSAFILLERHRASDDWYSATMSLGTSDQHYGPLYFVSECPQPSESLPEAKLQAAETQPQPESAVDLCKMSEIRKSAGFLRRLLAALGF